MKKTDIIAWILAARHDQSIESQSEFLEAKRLVESSAELKAVLEEEKAYYSEDADYLDFVRLPDEVRQRIKDKLRTAAAQTERAAVDPVSTTPQPIIPFPGRPLLLAASVVVLLAIGFATFRMIDSSDPVVVSSSQTIFFTSFQRFAVDQVEAGFELDYNSPSPKKLIAWLDKSGAPAGMDLDDRFQTLESMGCKRIDWEGRPISLICFRVNDDVVHLFVTGVSHLSSAEPNQVPGVNQIAGRDTMSWRTNEHAFVLVAHKQGQGLDPFSG